MATSRADIEALADALFPALDAGVVMSILDQYGTEVYERERERVQLAILRLSEGDENALLEYISAAKGDYRDVLMWADSPKPSPAQVEADRKLTEELLAALGKPPHDP